MKLALLRHGHTHWNREGRIQGRTDIPLDDAARAELAAQELPPGWQDARLVSSPLMRAAETAELVAGRAPERIEALREMNWGDWEGKHGKDLRADPKSGFRDIEHWGWGYAPPQGESIGDVRDRVMGWVDGLADDRVVAVCHIGVMRVILAVAHGWDFRDDPPFQIKRNRLFVVERDAGVWRALPEPIRLDKR